MARLAELLLLAPKRDRCSRLTSDCYITDSEDGSIPVLMLANRNDHSGPADVTETPRARRGFGIVCLLAIAILFLNWLTACSLPRVSAEERLFLNVSLDFLSEYQLPKQTFEGTPIGGLSAIAYDRQRDRLYALSDDRGRLSPARFYTLKLTLTSPAQEQESAAAQSESILSSLAVEKVTFLLNEAGEPYPQGTIDPEGIAISSQQTIFVSSEGVTRQGINPFVGEFDLETGQLKRYLPLPDRYLVDDAQDLQTGVRDNLGFEALTLNPTGSVPAQGEPLRLFTAVEAPLQQDYNPDTPGDQGNPNRLLHYLIGDGPPFLIAEHLYPLSPPPMFATSGLVELLALDQGGHFLSLERSFGLRGFQARLFQLAIDGATDTSRIASLKGHPNSVTPIRKRLITDFSNLDLTLDNVEGMTLGPRLPDGSQSLILVSDDNFQASEVTQFLLLRLRSGS